VSAAWTVVQIAELVRADEELLLRALGHLDRDARADMPDDGAWTLSGQDADELRTLLTQHRDIAEHLHGLAEHLPEYGVTATYPDVRDGAAQALAEGILDPRLVIVTVSVLDVRTGWRALAEALTSTDVRTSWTTFDLEHLLGAFRHADRRLIRAALTDVALTGDARWDQLTTEQADTLVKTLTRHASQA
jgi:hypothetical protein